MIVTDREWDEMKEAARLKLTKIRDEIREMKRGNRDYEEGVEYAPEQRPQTQSAEAAGRGDTVPTVPPNVGGAPPASPGA
jgi:hypothetical protein